MLFPEMYDIELPDFLSIKLGAEPKQGASRAVWDRHDRARQLYRSLVTNLPYRDSRAISQRTIDLLNAAQRYMLRDEFYRVLFLLAPQPCNRLNGDGLHRYLLKPRMPQRDSDFGFATYREMSQGFSPAARLARCGGGRPLPGLRRRSSRAGLHPALLAFVVPQPLHARLGDQSARAVAARPPRCDANAL